MRNEHLHCERSTPSAELTREDSLNTRCVLLCSSGASVQTLRKEQRTRRYQTGLPLVGGFYTDLARYIAVLSGS